MVPMIIPNFSCRDGQHAGDTISSATDVSMTDIVIYVLSSMSSGTSIVDISSSDEATSEPSGGTTRHDII